MMSSWNGTICTSSIAAKSVPRPRKLSRASAYPASTPKTTVQSSTPPVTMPELARVRSRSTRALMALKFSRVSPLVGARLLRSAAGSAWNAPITM